MSLNNALRTPSGFNSNNAALRDTSSPSLNATHESAHNNTSANASDSFSRAAIASTTRADLSALERPMLNSTRASTNTAAERPISNLENGVRSSPTAMTPNSEARVTAPSIEGSREPNTTPLASTSPETEASEKKENFWTWQNILPKVAIAIGTITLGIALWNTAAAAPALLKANGVLAGMGKVGAAFISNLGQAFLYVVVTPFVAAYEGIRATAIVLKDVIAAGARLLWQGVSNTASFAWNSVIVPTARFLAPAAEFIWNNVVVKAAILIKDVVVWSFQNVVRPVFEFIGPALKFAWDNVLYPVLDATFWAIGKVFEGAFWTLGKVLEGTFNVLSFLYTNAMVPVSRFIRSVGSAIGQALAPAASWVFNNVLAPVGRGIATAAIASYQYVIAPVASALGSAAQSVASGIAAAWRTVAQTISAVFA